MYSILLLCASIGTVSSLSCDGVAGNHCDDYSDKSFCCEGSGGNYCCTFDEDWNDDTLAKIMGVVSVHFPNT